MLDEIDFSKSLKLEPRSDSWDKVVMRIAKKEEKRECDRFFGFSALSIAASLLLVVGGIAISFTAKATALPENFSEEYTLESLSWFHSLGSGEAVSTFSTPIDTYYATRDLP